MAETIRLEEFTGLIQNRFVVAWALDQNQNQNPWLPTEFMLAQYITRILVVGRTSPLSMTLAADSSWTQVWRSPGAKEWSCLLGILQHMPGPVLVVIGPDIALTPKMVSGLKDVCTIAIRCPGSSQGVPVGVQPDQVFFPVITSNTLLPVVQEWVAKAVPRSLDLKTLIPQLAAQGYGLTVAENVWHWYKPADSPPLVTLTVAQVAKQVQILGAMMERMA